MAHSLDILRQRAEALDNAGTENPTAVKSAYESLVSLKAETKEEKNLVHEVLKRNEQKIIATNLVALESLTKKLEENSKIDFGDHVGAIAREGLETGQAVVSAGVDVVQTTTKNAVEGVGITSAYVRDLLADQAEKHPKRTAIVGALGGVAASAVLLKLYKWVTNKEVSTGRKIARGLGLGALTAGVLALIGINAKEAIAASPTPTPTPTPTPSSTPTPTESFPEKMSPKDQLQKVMEGGTISQEEAEALFKDPEMKKYIMDASEKLQESVVQAVFKGSEHMKELLLKAESGWNSFFQKPFVRKRMKGIGLEEDEAEKVMSAVHRVKEIENIA